MLDTPEIPTLVRDLTAKGLEFEVTHISWVFLDRDHVWKVKKPVNFGYLDFTSMEKRRRACESEVELNSRLSPEVYLGVVPVTLDGDGIHRLGGEGKAVDWAVQMIRLPASDRGDRRLMNGSLTTRHLENLANRLAKFHSVGPPGAWISRDGEVEAVARNVAENFIQSRAVLSMVLSASQASLLEGSLLGFLRDHGPVFQERVRSGRVRDGHGDLRLSQIYFDDKGDSTVLDCIEFNNRFRYGDVCSDISFLAMDLAIRGRLDLSEYFLAVYARASGDYDSYALVDFYESYRACVRGKIAAYGAADARASVQARQDAEKEAREYFRFALSIMGKPPTATPVIAIGGGIGTGKSTLAAALGRSLSIPVIDSDRTRKRMAGIDPWEKREVGPWEGIYRPEFSERVHAELRRRARVVMDSGRPVILEASFRSQAERTALRDIVHQAGHPFFFLECRADPELVRERLRARTAKPGVSDGREAIAAVLDADWVPVLETGWNKGLLVDTSQPLDVCLEKVKQFVGWTREVPA